MTDVIEIRGLVVSAYCGALPEEQQRRQPFRVDLDVGADLSAAGASDRLADTVDYGELCADVEALLRGGRFTLLEALAERIAELVLERALVETVTVTVTKLRPPVPQVLETSGVRLTRPVPT